ncbi:hypothetical protein GCM10028807_50460 [Spirosoma daeguense]
MKTYNFLIIFLVSNHLFAQNNYVQRTVNSVIPANYNTLVGPLAGNLTMTGINNSFVGGYTGYSNTTGFNNSFVGYAAGYNNTTGCYNVFTGFTAGENNTIGRFNVFTGSEAGYSNSTAYYNVFTGNQAGYSNTTGWYNVFTGAFSGQVNTTGFANTFTGFDAGKTNTTGSNNVMLGYNAHPASGNLQNAVAIGANAKVALNNAIVLGDHTNASIAVGIGTDSPLYPLDVRGIINLRNNGTLKFSHLSNPLFQGTTDQFLTVNEQGETVLARYRLKINHPDNWADRVFAPDYQLKPLSEIERYVQTEKHLPGMPSAEDIAQKGVDLAELNAKLLEKIEELTLHVIRLEKQTQQIGEVQQRIRQLETHRIHYRR